jgi:hypothetical protein
MFKPIASLILAGAFAMTAGCDEPKYTEVYRLPVGFNGWVLIKYGFKECPLIKRDGMTYTLIVPSSGVVCTSGLEGGEPSKRGYWVVPKFYRGSDPTPLPWTIPGQPGGWVWGGGQGGYGDDRTKSYQTYYIGPEAEYLAVVNDPKKGKEALLKEIF